MVDRSSYEHPRFSNKRGVIAEQYAQLQALHILEQAREMHPLPLASQESTIRAILQATEIALLNLHDLLQRTIDDVQARCFGAAAVKLSWARSFHSVMLHISSLPQKLGFVPATLADGRELSIVDSPAFKMYAETLKFFDAQILSALDEEQIPLADKIGFQSLDNSEMHCLHLIRICNHETTLWERNLRSVFVSSPLPPYEEFVDSRAMYRAVYDTMLEGDTCYTQFRAFHQIPEIFVAEINDHIEMAIRDLRAKALAQAYDHLRCLIILSESVRASLLPIADNLATADYHQIRENLGLTSGSHSVGIHYHLFRDLYEQLWSAFTTFLLDRYADHIPSTSVQEILREIDQKRFTNEQNFLLYLFVGELLKLRFFVHEWRELHLHFARNTIGGNHTKSLTGSADAIQALRKMCETALDRDSLQVLLDVRKLDNPAESTSPLPLTAYFTTEEALDHRILEITGSITKQRFKDVQERAGIFASKSTFIPPAKRKV